MTHCPQCSQEFVNAEEVDQHVQMVHADKWHGHSATSQDGDENAVGAVSPKTADTIATEGGTERPSARERAHARQYGTADTERQSDRETETRRGERTPTQKEGGEGSLEDPGEHPEHWER